MTQKNTDRVALAVVLTLAAITGVIPFASDMYIASLPSMNAEFDTPTWMGQLTLTGFLLTLGIGQLFGGPITDAYGRRRPLIIGLALFIVGAVGAALAPSMWLLISARLLQGLGGALAMVVANSSVRDRASGAAATRLFSVMLTVSALAPIISPALGGLFESSLGWRSVFWFLAGLGAVVLVASVLFLGESLPAERRSPLALGSALGAYGRLMRNSRFMLPMGALWMMFMFLFSYIGGASYVYQGDFGLDPATFGLVFGATGIVLPFGAIAANRLAGKVESGRLALLTVSASLLGAVMVLVCALAGTSIWWVVAGMAIALLGLGAAEPVLMSLSLSQADQRSAGSAAALMGAGQFLLGALAASIAGTAGDAGAVPWAVLLVLFAIVATILSGAEARRNRHDRTTDQHLSRDSVARPRTVAPRRAVAHGS